MDIVNFLTDVVFYDNLVGEPRRLDGLDAFQNVVTDIQLATVAIKVVVGDANYKIVAKSLGSL